MIYGWTVERCLAMPASRFFAMLKAGRKQRNLDRCLWMIDLCDTASIPLGNADYYRMIKSRYTDQAGLLLTDRAPEPAPPKPALDPCEEKTKNLMFEILAQAKRSAY